MKRRTIVKIAGLLYLLAYTVSTGVLAAEPDVATEKETGKFIRIERDDSGNPLSLQTAVVHFSPQDSSQGQLTVDLVGAVHVGEESYYEALNDLFETYDVVLYELVAPEGTRVPKGGRSSSHPVALLQNGMKDLLGLEHQMQCVDYTKDNFVHADMSPDEMAKSMSDRGESWVSTFFRMMGAGIAQQSRQQAQGKSPEMDLLAAILSDDRAGALKRMMAEQFEDVESMMAALDGPQGSTLITERNKVALEKLREQIDAGKKKIAVFYGAGHLKDMQQRLIDDFELEPVGTDWMSAWNLAALDADTPKP
jgi:hypothetical protein